MPNRISGAPSGWLSKWPSIAMTLTGWCSSVLRPCMSPAKIWIGVTIAAIHMAIENMVRTASLAAFQQVPGRRPPPTTKAVVR
jgi:hypothetical protein